jgi:hypothetical protein
MSRICIWALSAIVLSTTLTLVAAAQTQPSTEISTAPMPAQFLAAKRMFIANGAGDNDPGITKYTNGPDGLYNQLYVDVKALGRYELVASPSDADIVLELRIEYAVFNPNFTYPKFKAEIRDPKTNVLLWTFTEPVNGALLAKSGRKNIAQSLSKLTDDLKKAGTSQ